MSRSGTITGKLHTIQVRGLEMRDWQGFHDEFARAFGFPDFYGRNMDAWIDCMTNLDEAFSAFHVDVGDLVVVEVSDYETFYEKHRDISSEMYECAAIVNARRIKMGSAPILLMSVAA